MKKEKINLELYNRLKERCNQINIEGIKPTKCVLVNNDPIEKLLKRAAFILKLSKYEN